MDKITFENASLHMYVGETKALKVNTEPSYATNKNIIWESDNTNTASIDNNGIITAVRSGQAKIRARSEDGGASAGIKVTVSVVLPKAANRLPKVKKPEITGEAASLDSVTLRVKNGSETKSKCYVYIGGKTASVKKYSITVKEKKKNKLKKNYFKMQM